MLILLWSCGKPISETGEKEGEYFGSQIEESSLFETSVYHNFNLLPLKGFAQRSKEFWTGDSWNLKSGAINKRWNSRSINQESPHYRTLLSMSEKDLKELSPSEKFDIFMGRYHYPFKEEVQRLVKNGVYDWEGLCHGWAGAAINHSGPKPKVVVNADGIKVPFGSSDLKALLSWAYSKAYLKDNDFLGKRCEEETDTINDYCEDDLSAKDFHILVANLIGLRGRSLIADIERSKEVWNHPILSYSSDVVAKNPSRRLILKTTLVYLDVSENNSWEPCPQITGKLTVKYALYLSEKGNILRGEWLSRERPDFIWRMSTIEDLDQYLPGLEGLIK
jgi:hypothetical protein